MRYRLRIRPATHADVDTAADFIAQDSLQAALRFYDAIDRTYREIREHPNRWPRYEFDHPRLTNVRKRSVFKFGDYLIFYQIDGAVIDIIRVLHGARDIPSILGDE